MTNWTVEYFLNLQTFPIDVNCPTTSSIDALISNETMALTAPEALPYRSHPVWCTSIRSPRSDSDSNRHPFVETKYSRSHVHPIYRHQCQRNVFEWDNGNTRAGLVTLVCRVRNWVFAELPFVYQWHSVPPSQYRYRAMDGYSMHLCTDWGMWSENMKIFRFYSRHVSLFHRRLPYVRTVFVITYDLRNWIKIHWKLDAI